MEKKILNEVARFQAIAGIQAIGSLGNSISLKEDMEMEEGFTDEFSGEAAESLKNLIAVVSTKDPATAKKLMDAVQAFAKELKGGHVMEADDSTEEEG